MLLFQDPFDAYSATADLTKRWGSNSSTSTVTFSSNGGRWGGGCLSLSGASVGGGAPSLQSNPLTQTPTNIAGVAFWLNCSAAPSAAAGFLAMGTLSLGMNGALFVLRINTSGTLSVVENNTAVQTSAGTVCDGNWHWIEARFQWPTGTATSSMVVDGVAQLDATLGGQVLTNFSSTIGLAPISASVTLKIDDLIVWDNQTGSQTGEIVSASYPLGAKRIRTGQPTGAGTNTNWAPDSGSNYARVNENPPDDDASYVQASSVGVRDSYAFGGALIPSTENPSWIVVSTRCRNADAGSINMQGLTYSGGTYGLGDMKAAPSAYQTNQYPIFRDPATSAAWTASGVNNAEYGIGV